MTRGRSKEGRPAAQAVSFKAIVNQPLGYRRLVPTSGRSLEEEIQETLNTLSVKRDDVLVVTIAHESGGGT